MRKALGKGLEALFPGTTAPAPPGRLNVPVADIVANPQQPRRHFEAEPLAALADSVKRHGLLQPLVVRRTGMSYELIAGERRLRAAIAAGLEEVPVILRDAAPGECLELALIENLQREDLSPLEEAEAYRHLIDEYGLTQEEIAQRVGKSRPAVANALRLLTLPDDVKVQLESGDLSAGHARAVLAVEGAEERVRFAQEIAVEKLSKGEAERRAASRRGHARTRVGRPPVGDVHLRAVAEELTRGLGTRVRVTRRMRGGAIEIEFYSDAELERLLGHLRAAVSGRG
jgi:ParB family chromosome partitioning protein